MWDGETFRCDTVASCIKPGTIVELTDVRMTQAAYGPVMLICCWAKGYKEPLHLVTNMTSADEACHIGKYLSGISKLSHVVALKKGIETELRASRPLISFGMRTLGMTRQIHDSCLQRPIEPGDIACFQGLDHVT